MIISVSSHLCCTAVTFFSSLNDTITTTLNEGRLKHNKLINQTVYIQMWTNLDKTDFTSIIYTLSNAN